MILKLKEISWFHDDNEFKKNRPLGVIPLTSVYHCVPANRFKETSDIIVIIRLTVYSINNNNYFVLFIEI